MRFVIVTGMSGAGKSTTLKMLEDVGYYCVDNLPIPLIPKLAELLRIPGGAIDKLALGLDIRGGVNFLELDKILREMDVNRHSYEIIFLDASDEILIKRYKETRRKHPLAEEGRVDKGISLERSQLQFLKQKADYIVDTSQMLTRELHAELQKIFVDNREFRSLYVTILSFGFKYGIPTDADMVFDVRFLPNPYYLEELRSLNGNNSEIRNFVMNNDKAREFLKKLEDMVAFLIPNYIMEGKHQLVIAIGCTGGKHRSVTLANELYEQLKSEDMYGIKIEHRDIEKDARIKGI